MLLRVDEGTVGEQGLAALDANGRRRLDRLELLAADDAGRRRDGAVLLVAGSAAPNSASALSE